MVEEILRGEYAHPVQLLHSESLFRRAFWQYESQFTLNYGFLSGRAIKRTPKLVSAIIRIFLVSTMCYI